MSINGHTVLPSKAKHQPDIKSSDIPWNHEHGLWKKFILEESKCLGIDSG